MKIKMILTNAFDPDPRVYKEAKTLVECGHDVEIMCWDREGKYIKICDEVFDGIKIKRFFPEGRYGSGIKQIFGYVRYIKEILKYLKNNEYDCIHCHDFDGLIAGYILKLKNKNIRLVYDEHDLFYLYFKNRQGAVNKIIYKAIKSVELFLLRKVDYHIVVTPNMKSLYKSKDNIVIITNAPLKSSFKYIEKPECRNIVVGFIGTVRYIDELKVLADAANNFDNIDIFIAGKGTKLKELEEYISIKQYKNVELYGEFKFDELEKLYSHIDITYLVYPTKDAEISLPNKFFESIITETPMIATKGAEFGKIINDKSFGWAVDRETLDKDLQHIFSQLANQSDLLECYKDNIKKYKEMYYWEDNVSRLLDIYKK